MIRLSSLGDVLLTMPAVQAIKAACPASAVSWLVEGPPSELLACQDFIDRVIEFPRRAISRRPAKKGAFFPPSPRFRPSASALRRQAYDLVVDFHGIVKSALFALDRPRRQEDRLRQDLREGRELARLRREDAGPERRIHKAARNMLLASAAGAPALPEVDLKVPPEAAAYIDAFLAGRRHRAARSLPSTLSAAGGAPSRDGTSTGTRSS